MDKNKLSRLCEKKNISIAELERNLGMSNGSLRKDGDIKSDRLYAISKFFDVTMEYLMGEEDSKKGIPQYNPRIQDFIEILPKLTNEQIDSLIHTAELFVSMNDVR